MPHVPKVTVVIPAYNVENFIAHSLRSVLAQTFVDFEVIVVNDGSTDRTLDVVAGFADSRVRAVTQRNRGLAGARNTGIRQARGRYIAFLDADDLWHPDKLARHVAHLDARPGVGVSYCPSILIDDAGAPMGCMQSPKLTDIAPSDVFLRNPVGNGSVPVIRAATLADIAVPHWHDGAREARWFDESFRQSEDIECWTRIALTTSWHFEGIGTALTLYRINSGGLSANVEKQLASWERMVATTAAYAPDFVAQWGAVARSYQLRYLARRAVRGGAALQGLTLLRDALRASPAMLRQEPARTLATFAAALLGAVLPRSFYCALEAWGLRAAGLRQRKLRPATGVPC